MRLDSACIKKYKNNCTVCAFKVRTNDKLKKCKKNMKKIDKSMRLNGACIKNTKMICTVCAYRVRT